MKKLIAAALALSLLSPLALAEPPRGGPGPMFEELDLSDEQREQIREIRESGDTRKEIHAVLTPEQREKAKSLRKKHHDKRAGRMEHLKDELDLSDEQLAQMREIRQNGGSRDEVRAVLTAEQQEQFDQLRAEHKGKGKR
ncbi:MAG: hypothetical protein CME59_18745 [Halioglobus sp.]|nr:hypothetical protein [Halioglobus sp.]|tara:strand:+ start:456 stop:875 length:420 start_codon:yes stop_codon:yes gene_type:complete